MSTLEENLWFLEKVKEDPQKGKFPKCMKSVKKWENLQEHRTIAKNPQKAENIPECTLWVLSIKKKYFMKMCDYILI